MKRILLAITMISVIGFLPGCETIDPATTYNPEAVYRVPANGLWMQDLIDDATGQKQGRMFVLPGTFLVYDGSEIQ